MKVDRDVSHHWQMTAIDFEVKRSKVKLSMGRNGKTMMVS
jgi:hypothetical protein